MKQRLLLLGAAGQVGFELDRVLHTRYDVIPAGRAEADLADQASLRRAVAQHRPAIIINAAAYTAVDRAEQEPDVARSVNAAAPALLAGLARASGALLVHYSTDYVFDGKLGRPYVEEDVPAPLNVYGRTKLEGDEAVIRSGARHLIIRTAWVYAARGRNFVSTVRRLLDERDELRIVNDQTGTPTSAPQIAEATAAALAKGAEGLFNVAAHGETTWFDFAREIAAVAGLRKRIVPISSDEFGAPARRPAWSVLSTAKYAREIGAPPGPWRPELARIMAG